MKSTKRVRVGQRIQRFGYGYSDNVAVVVERRRGMYVLANTLGARMETVFRSTVLSSRWL